MRKYLLSIEMKVKVGTPVTHRRAFYFPSKDTMVLSQIIWKCLKSHTELTQSESEVKGKVARWCLTLCDPMDSMEFSRPEYWSG